MRTGLGRVGTQCQVGWRLAGAQLSRAQRGATVQAGRSNPAMSRCPAAPPRLCLSTPAFQDKGLKGVCHILQAVPQVAGIVLVIQEVDWVLHPGHACGLPRVCGAMGRQNRALKRLRMAALQAPDLRQQCSAAGRSCSSEPQPHLPVWSGSCGTATPGRPCQSATPAELGGSVAAVLHQLMMCTGPADEPAGPRLAVLRELAAQP